MTSPYRPTVSLTGTRASVGDVIPSTACDDHSSFSAHVTDFAAVGTSYVIEVSNDGVNWVVTRAQNVQDATIITGAIPGSAVSIYRGEVVAKFIRARCSAYTGPGNIAVALLLSPDVFSSVIKST